MAMFHQFDAEAILQVPLSRRVVQDGLVWSFAKRGRYTIRSGYFVAKQLRKDELNVGESSEHRALGFLWSHLWKARNTVIHGGVFQHPSRLAQRAVDYLKEYTAAQDSLHVHILNYVPVQQTWQPPPEMFFKLNFDDACFDEGAASGYGAMIRNEKGDVMAALAVRGGAMRDNEEMEVMACRKELEFAIDAGFTEIILEGDNALVMKMISQAKPERSRLGLIYEDIWCLAAGFRSISYNCIRHSANGVAHSLARFARLLDNEIVWLEEDPPPVVDALYLDSTFLN
ncbi:uncharacterized protein LOC115983486 [Quercus lobata]|uniref:uncharacterized protein LOC115983486 n=1 Tax=Quercus lobata TaxID=97700 RepID=UPI0012459FF1|nr:uncharacterized protein LOC115983486 [Quercus lobata]